METSESSAACIAGVVSDGDDVGRVSTAVKSLLFISIKVTRGELVEWGKEYSLVQATLCEHRIMETRYKSISKL